MDDDLQPFSYEIGNGTEKNEGAAKGHEERVAQAEAMTVYVWVLSHDNVGKETEKEKRSANTNDTERAVILVETYIPQLVTDRYFRERYLVREPEFPE